MKITVILTFGLLALVAVALAADATGTWKGKLETQDGSRELTFNLKADGDKLTGTVAGLLDKAIDVKEGKVEGATLSFSVMSEWEGNPIKLVYKGELAGDEIRFTMGTDDGTWSTEVKAKRVTA
jgi:nitrogen fixation protein FixH